MTKSEALLKENSKYVPGGVASINRLTDPCICFAKAKGAYMWDLDGNKYIDYHAGFAPHILGFAESLRTAQSQKHSMMAWHFSAVGPLQMKVSWQNCF